MPASKNLELSRKYGGGYGWLVAHKDHAGDGCLIWPLGCDQEGRGQVCVGNGKVRKAHRVMCEMVNGPCPPGHQAAHECGNGHLGCVHPKHLKWKTQSANTLDRVRHGRHTGNPCGNRTAFSPKEIESLRADILAGEMTVIGMSRKYNVARSVIQFWRQKFAANPNMVVRQARRRTAA